MQLGTEVFGQRQDFGYFSSICQHGGTEMKATESSSGAAAASASSAAKRTVAVLLK